MELHKENPFKIRSYQNAYLVLRKMDKPFGEFTYEELTEIKGIGEAIAEKIQSLVNTGRMPTLDKYLDKTPAGVVEMLHLQGLGPKKIEVIWKELGIESPGELLYACNENRLAELKGFGEKTQQKIIEAIGFLQANQGRFLFTQANHHARTLITEIKKQVPKSQSEITGELRRGVAIVDHAAILTTCTREDLEKLELKDMMWTRHGEDCWEGTWNEIIPVKIYFSSKADWAKNWLISTGPSNYVTTFFQDLSSEQSIAEEDIYSARKFSYLSPELRDQPGIDRLSNDQLNGLIRQEDIRGVIHNHSTYSDGIHSLKEMAEHAKSLGYEYLVITDHSQAAVYAKGMNIEKLKTQWEEIDQLHATFDQFDLLKGIECDILSEGILDYNEEILSQFDLVIGSIHTAFQMDKEKATRRIIKAIENRYTNIIGHPSGRLLLTREGYPLDVEKIIDACKANQVALELNANPQRLDLDYTWIPKCVEKGVFISINPDAHNRSAIQDIRYGVTAARKGLLPKSLCLNALTKNELMRFCKKQTIVTS